MFKKSTVPQNMNTILNKINREIRLDFENFKYKTRALQYESL